MGEKQGHTPAKFREDLLKIMPGYQWTVRRPTNKDGSYLEATGIQSSGFNRLSTLSVIRTDRAGMVVYEAKSAGFGTRAKWLHRNSDGTLARALRGLQDHYEAVSNTYRAHAAALKTGRIDPSPTGEDSPANEGEGVG